MANRLFAVSEQLTRRPAASKHLGTQEAPRLGLQPTQERASFLCQLVYPLSIPQRKRKRGRHNSSVLSLCIPLRCCHSQLSPMGCTSSTMPGRRWRARHRVGRDAVTQYKNAQQCGAAGLSPMARRRASSVSVSPESRHTQAVAVPSQAWTNSSSGRRCNETRSAEGANSRASHTWIADTMWEFSYSADTTGSPDSEADRQPTPVYRPRPKPVGAVPVFTKNLCRPEAERGAGGGQGRVIVCGTSSRRGRSAIAHGHLRQDTPIFPGYNPMVHRNIYRSWLDQRVGASPRSCTSSMRSGGDTMDVDDPVPHPSRLVRDSLPYVQGLLYTADITRAHDPNDRSFGQLSDASSLVGEEEFFDSRDL